MVAIFPLFYSVFRHDPDVKQACRAPNRSLFCIHSHPPYIFTTFYAPAHAASSRDRRCCPAQIILHLAVWTFHGTLSTLLFGRKVLICIVDPARAGAGARVDPVRRGDYDAESRPVSLARTASNPSPLVRTRAAAAPAASDSKLKVVVEAAEAGMSVADAATGAPNLA